MDIPLLSMAMSQANVKQDASIALMKKTMGSAEQQGEALQKLMDSTGVNEANAKAMQHAAQPHLGSSIDLKL